VAMLTIAIGTALLEINSVSKMAFKVLQLGYYVH
jgi:hypothetical protein